MCNCKKNKCSCSEPICGCPVELESACVTVNADFPCSSIESGLTLNQVLEELDAFICAKFSEVSSYFNIINVGNGAVLYAGIDGVGNKKIKSVISSDDSIVIVENTNTIDITVPSIIPPDGSETKINAGTNISVTGNGTTATPYLITNTFSIGDVSATEEGIVNNTSLQELGGVDKIINFVRIGRGNNDGNNSTVLGYNTLKVNTIGANNTAIGAGVLENNTSGQYNTGVGSYSLNNNTTGSNNVSLGDYTLTNNTVGSNNVAVGHSVLPFSTTGIDNTVVGSGASYFSTTASRNTVLGFAAMQENTTGGNNIALGYQAGGNLSTGTGNILVGTQDSFNTGITTGSNNTLIIPNTRLNTGITTGSGNTVIGGVTGLSATSSNSLILADGVGNIAIRKNTNNELIAPNQTIALINSESTGKAIVTKEYLNSLAPDGSETKVTAGLNTTVTGAGTTSNPYVINSSSTDGSETKIIAGAGTTVTGNGTTATPYQINTPKNNVMNVGFFSGLNVGSIGSLSIGGDVVSAVTTYGTAPDSIILVTMANSMSSMNYIVDIKLEGLSANLDDDNDIATPIFKKVSTTQFEVGLREMSNNTQNLKVHMQVIQY